MVNATSATAAKTHMIAAFDAHTTLVKGMSASELSTFTLLVSSALARVNSYAGAQLSVPAQLMQTTHAAVLQELFQILTSGGTMISVTATPSATLTGAMAAFTQLLASVDAQMTSALVSLGVSTSDLAAISSTAIPTATTASVTTAVNNISAKINSVGPSLGLLLTSTQKSNYASLVSMATTTLSTFPASTLSTQAQMIQAANLQVLAVLGKYL